MNKALWIALIRGQILSAGNMNYQQKAGYHEINYLYPEHPSESRVYLTKAAEIGAVYAATQMLPEHKTEILATANLFCWGFIVRDRFKGIRFSMRW